MLYVGIDNGFKGAVVGVDEKGLVILNKMPVEYAGGRGANQPEKMAEIIINLMAKSPIGFVVIEDAYTMGHEGRAGLSKFSQGFGIWLGILSALAIPHAVYRPKVWQGMYLNGVPGRDTKERSYNKACRLYPEIADQLTGPNGAILDGFCDALLMADLAKKIGGC